MYLIANTFGFFKIKVKKFVVLTSKRRQFNLKP